MEPLHVTPEGDNNPSLALSVVPIADSSTSKPFIEANTEGVSLEELRHQHIIPSFIDATPLISHADFIDVASMVVNNKFRAERILAPSIRVSHKVVGRISSAKDVPVADLQDWQKTVFYQRAMFVMEVASINDTVDGQPVSLMIGGARVYDGMNNRSGGDEHFKVCCGFSVRICSNLMVTCNGLAKDICVKSIQQLEEAVYELISSYDAITDLSFFQQLKDYHLNESQFAHLLGKCRMYQFLSASQKKEVGNLQFGDAQINNVCRDYYRDNSFCRDDDGSINLFKVHSLFTAANKQSYIDTFLDRSVNASSFIQELAYALEHKSNNWFLG